MRLFFWLNQLTANLPRPVRLHFSEVTITPDLIIKVGECNSVVLDDGKDSEAQDVQQMPPSSEAEIAQINKTSYNRSTDRTV